MANGCVLVGAGITLVENEIAIIIGRFIYGVASGSFSVLVPSFSILSFLTHIVNELAPTELKGPLGATTQILITVGIQVAFLLGLPVPEYPKVDIFIHPDSFAIL